MEFLRLFCQNKCNCQPCFSIVVAELMWSSKVQCGVNQLCCVVGNRGGAREIIGFWRFVCTAHEIWYTANVMSGKTISVASTTVILLCFCWFFYYAVLFQQLRLLVLKMLNKSFHTCWPFHSWCKCCDGGLHAPILIEGWWSILLTPVMGWECVDRHWNCYEGISCSICTHSKLI